MLYNRRMGDLGVFVTEGQAQLRDLALKTVPITANTSLCQDPMSARQRNLSEGNRGIFVKA